MITTPYETSVLNKLNMNNVVSKLSQLVIMNGLVEIKPLSDEYPHAKVMGLLNTESDINLFFQPIPVLIPGRPTTIVVDLRPFKNAFTPPVDGAVSIAKPNESLSQLLAAAIFTCYWRDDADGFCQFNQLPYTVFGSWLSELLGKRLGLDNPTILKLMVTFQLFYLTRGKPTLQLTEEDKQAMSIGLARKANVGMEVYFDIFKEMKGEDLRDIDGICHFIKEQQWSPRLSKFSTRDLYTLAMIAWPGQGNPKETTLVALEYPPVWVAMLFCGIRSTFYQRTDIGQVLKRLDRTSYYGAFKNQVQAMLKATI